MSTKIALVTGAASGLGLASATKLAQSGHHLCLVDIDAAGLEKAAQHIRNLGSEAVTFCADLGQAEKCQEAINSAIDAFGRIDTLCNIAAVMLPARTTDMAQSAFETTLAVNLAAPFYLMQAALPHLIDAHGSIVNVASAVGISAQAYNAAYCATKAGLIQMTKSLAMEYIHEPIRINAVAPGGMMTPLARNMMNVENPDPGLLARTTPLRGLVEMDDVADMVAFLASEKARGHHGSCIVIDKGMCAG